MKTYKIYNCFISSPGDCEEERNICEEVIESINKGLADYLGINFKSLKWENNVLPDMGVDGQELIDEEVENIGYDIFIGVMGYRFGRPTKLAGSGTEHEFLKALEKKKNSNDNLPQILFFFSEKSINPNELDLEQYQKVKDFKNSISSNGLYEKYNDLGDFKDKLKSKIELFIKKIHGNNGKAEAIEQFDKVKHQLEEDLQNSLTSYNNEPSIWLDPILCKHKNIPQNPSKSYEDRIDIEDILSNIENIIIKAPSEFGLTSLAHYLKLEAWKQNNIWLYIDIKDTKKHKIIKDIDNKITQFYNGNRGDMKCIILDSVNFEENGVLKMVKIVSDEFKDIPLIIMNTVDNAFFVNKDEENDEDINISRKFKEYYLLALPQNGIRKLINEYSSIKSLTEDEDIIIQKVTSDLNTLNIHRTPKNCITILKASTKLETEYSPINRTRLLEIILTIIFEEVQIPTYKDKKPDIKDCQFVLGYLCEKLIRNEYYYFTKDEFFKTLGNFCKSNFIDLDLTYLFDVLLLNNIIIQRIDGYSFKNAYWLFYFSAQRMNLNEEFKNYIYSEKKYVDFPEIIEFYSGIDRNKKDAIEILLKDIKETLSIVSNKVQINNDLNPYKSIKWTPNTDMLLKEENKIKNEVISSGLPNEVKDKYSDKTYNQLKPYNQVLNTVLKDYSFLVLMKQISACSRVLRNSDFVNPDLKKELLDYIMLAWNEVSKILIVLSPILADRGRVSFEGANFELIENDFEYDNPNDKRFAVLLAVPKNVVDFFKNDIFSNKIGTLLYDKIENERNSLLKHELILLVISERPDSWNTVVDKYIVALDKNSFFLSDVSTALETQFDYHATEIPHRRILESLLHKCRAKHIFNKDNPDLGLINKVRRLK